MMAACSSVPEISTVRPSGWDASVVKKQQIKHWGIKARLGIQTEQEGGSFDLFWNQQFENYQIRLIAPFGQGTFRMVGN